MVNNNDGGADDDAMPLNNVRRRNQEVPLIFTRALQWKHTTVAVQMTLALTGTHSKALLTISLLTNRYIFTVHLYTIHTKNDVAFVKKEKHSVPVTKTN